MGSLPYELESSGVAATSLVGSSAGALAERPRKIPRDPVIGLIRESDSNAKIRTAATTAKESRKDISDRRAMGNLIRHCLVDSFQIHYRGWMLNRNSLCDIRNTGIVRERTLCGQPDERLNGYRSALRGHNPGLRLNVRPLDR